MVTRTEGGFSAKEGFPIKPTVQEKDDFCSRITPCVNLLPSLAKIVAVAAVALAARLIVKSPSLLDHEICLLENAPIDPLSKIEPHSNSLLDLCLPGDSPEISMPSPYGLTPHSRVNDVINDLHYGIRESMGLPVPEYYQIPQDQCYDIATKEEELQKHMRYILPEEMSESFGNKHTNLVKMHKLVKTLERSDLEVPLPRGIASYQVRHFIQERAPRVFEAWKEISSLESRSPEDPEVHKLLEEIHQEIEKAFASPDAYEELGLSEELNPWIESLKKEGKSLMVRSTGAEDSKKMANAGGNLSRTYVKPDKKEITKAIGDVVGSYFGASSLQNRLNAGVDPFSEELQLSVTLQELIGEPIGGAKSLEEVPVSFVLFTGEPLYVGEEKFRVMRISATFGHGEAVVSNQGIGTDTVLVLQSMEHPDQLYTLYDNKEKRERLAPIQKEDLVSLTKVNNPKELIHTPALSDDKVVSLFTSGILMESFFKWGSTDIEGVIHKGKIHFVQARPVNRQMLLPTYITDSPASKHSIQADVLVMGKASAFPITNTEQVLIATTLEGAERKFKKGKHKLVVVAEPEPENSHPVVNFSGLGIPCLYTKEDFSSLFPKINKEHPLAVSMQTGTLHLWDNNIAKLNDHIKEGFAVHPAKIAISLPIEVPFPLQEPTNFSPEIIGLVKEISSNSTKEHKIASLQKLKISSEITHLQELIKELEQKNNPLKEVKVRLKALKLLEKELHKAIVELERTIQQAKPGERMKELFHLKVLDTLLFGSTSNVKGEGHVALAHLANIKADIHQLIDYQNRLAHPSHLSHLLLKGKESSKEAFSAWKDFLLDVDNLAEKKQITAKELHAFKELISLLETTNTLPFWLLFFQQSQMENPLERFRAIFSEKGQFNEDWMGSLVEEQKYFATQAEQRSRFASPLTYPTAWKELQSHIRKQTSPEFLEQLKHASSLAKTMVFRVMKQTVTTLDTVAKTVKSSAQFEGTDRVKEFKNILISYFQLMDLWSHALIPDRLQEWENGKLYFSQIQAALQKSSDNNPRELLPSSDFSVAAAIIGSRTTFTRHLPETLEDVLTLCHQNILTSLHTANDLLISEDTMKESLLPQPLKDALEIMEKPRKIQIQKMGIAIENHEITVSYNIPLMNHSGHLKIHYNIENGKMRLEGKILGENQEGRWGDLSSYIDHLEQTKYTLIHPVDYTNQDLTFEWEIDSTKLESALEDYETFLNISEWGSVLGFRFAEWVRSFGKFLPM